MELDEDTKRKLYRSLCAEADELLKEFNPCKITDKGCLRGMFCCEKCEYLVENKCSVNALLCKLWLCKNAVDKVDKQFVIKAENIFTRADSYDLVMFRGSEDDVIKLGDQYSTEIEMPWCTVYYVSSAKDNTNNKK